MHRFNVYLPDEIPISRLLFYTAKLHEDLQAAERARKTEEANRRKPRMNLPPQTIRSSGKPRLYRKR